MKIKSILTIFLFCMMSTVVLHTSSILAEEESLRNTTIFFYNAADEVEAIPFMSVSFLGISDEDMRKVTEWQKEIQKNFDDLGGIFIEEDYKKKMPEIMPNYLLKFLETKTKVIIVEFPRRRQGFLLRSPERLKQKTPSAASIQKV